MDNHLRDDFKHSNFIKRPDFLNEKLGDDSSHSDLEETKTATFDQ
jgi:hypothetical protein